MPTASRSRRERWFASWVRATTLGVPASVASTTAATASRA